MRDAPSQLDMRENTASSRQRAPRLVVDIDSSVNWTQGENTLLSLNDPLVEASPRPPHAAQVAATGEKCYTDDTSRPVHLFCAYLASWRLRNVIPHVVRLEQEGL
jgi:hypothetical protein